jgi:hypothetical protein
VGPNAGLNALGERNLLPLPGIEPRISGRPWSSVGTVPTTLSGLREFYIRFNTNTPFVPVPHGSVTPYGIVFIVELNRPVCSFVFYTKCKLFALTIE